AGGWEVVLGATGRLARSPAAADGPPAGARQWGSALWWLAWATVIASSVVAYVYAIQPNVRYDLALDIQATGSSGSLFSFLDQRVGLDPGVWFPSLVRPDPLSIGLTVAWASFALALVWIGRRRAVP
ncbi:MAG: hypothetical protein ACRDGT_11400, partial [Candidatus Limnocylindria bacterium]